jgi:hypothetical protein
LILWVAIAALALALTLVTPFSGEVQWNEAAAYVVMLLVVGGAYELWRWLKTRDKTYRLAFGLGFFGAFLLFWANGAVGIIGSENNPANLMYGAVFVVGLVGVLLSRFRPRGMARTLFAAAAVQMLIPVFALFVWPAQASWGEAGVIGVFIINSIFAMIFVASAWLFRRAGSRYL